MCRSKLQGWRTQSVERGEGAMYWKQRRSPDVAPHQRHSAPAIARNAIAAATKSELKTKKGGRRSAVYL